MKSSPAACHFHWKLSSPGVLPNKSRIARDSGQPAEFDYESLRELAQLADQQGIDSIVLDDSLDEWDPMLLATALGLETRSIRFFIPARPALVCPGMFVQQFNTLSALLSGRTAVLLDPQPTSVASHPVRDRAEATRSWSRLKEFTEVCSRLWLSETAFDFHGSHYQIEQGRIRTPYVGATGRCPLISMHAPPTSRGQPTPEPVRLVWRSAASSDVIASAVSKLRAEGREIGLCMGLLIRSNANEAVRVARQREFTPCAIAIGPRANRPRYPIENPSTTNDHIALERWRTGKSNRIFG